MNPKKTSTLNRSVYLPLIVAGLSAVCGRAALSATPSRLLPSPAAKKVSASALQPKAAAMRGLPLAFEADYGQFDSASEGKPLRLDHFLARGPGYRLGLSPTRADLSLRTRDGAASSLTLRWLGGNPQARLSGGKRLPGTMSYFKGADPKGWTKKVPLYEQVRVKDAYPDIDLLFYGNNGELEYDFLVAPHADPSVIRLRFEGAKGMRVNAAGELVLQVAEGEVVQKAPVLYQEAGGKRVAVEGKYALAADGTVGFEIGSYDRSRPLVIDPILVYSNLWGTKEGDNGDGKRVVLDAQGNVYVFSTAIFSQGDQDALVLKLNPQGDTLLGSALLGGYGTEESRDIAVDADGNVYFTLTSDSDDQTATPDVNEGFPVTPNAFIKERSYDIYSSVVGKMDANFEGFYYASRFYSSDPTALAVDGNGHILLTGSGNYIGNTQGTIQTGNGCNDSYRNNPFLAKFDPAAETGEESLVFSTFFNSACGRAEDLAVDAEGNAYLTGETTGQIVATIDAAQRKYAGGYGDAFFVKINPTGTALLYATHLGGGSTEKGRAITLDAQGNVYIAGETYDQFPTTPGVVQPDHSGGDGIPSDGFVTKYDPSGRVVFSTYLGGVETDVAAAVAVDAEGYVYVGGYTESTDFPTARPIQEGHKGYFDAFVTVLSPDASQVRFSTLLGGDGFDHVTGIAVDSERKSVYAVGNAYSPDFLRKQSAELEDMPGKEDERTKENGDLFLVKVDLSDLSGGGPTDPEVPTRSPGDVNGDGKVNIADAIEALQASVGSKELSPEAVKATDLNGNGKVEITDVTRILRMAVGLEAPGGNDGGTG